MLVDAVRRLAEPAEKLLTQSFRFAGWVVGRAAAPLFSFAITTGRPVVKAVSALSGPALEKLFAVISQDQPGPSASAPRTTSRPPTKVAAPPGHVAAVPTAPHSPTPAAAHAEADALLARSGRRGSVPAAADLPVEDWDGLTIAAIRQRTRTLSSEDVLSLLSYERAHAARPAVLLNLENRLAKLAHTS